MRQSTFLRKVLEALHTAGWTQFTVKSDDETMLLTQSPLVVVRECRHVDEAYIMVSNGTARGWLRVIWQGPNETYESGEEIISDYTVNLESILEPVYEAIQ